MAIVSPPLMVEVRGKALWTLGNFLMLLGVYVLLFVGGLLADERYNYLAAQGDSEIPLPEMPLVATTSTAVASGAATTPVSIVQPTAVAPTPTAAAGQMPEEDDLASMIIERPRYSLLPELNNAGDGKEINTLPPVQSIYFGPSTLASIRIPGIKVNRKVQPVGMRVEVQNGKPVAFWEVAKYTVGHHENTANPGQQGNIVLAGHSGGDAYPFNALYYLEAGDEILLRTQDDKQHVYVVSERHVVDEVGPQVTEEQRRENARFIEPTATEMVTMVTCWPLTGKDKFTQRVIVRAVPKDGGDVVASGPSTPGREPPQGDGTAISTEPTSDPVPQDPCSALQSALVLSNGSGKTNTGRFTSLDDVYLMGLSRQSHLVGRTVYWRVTTPNGAIKLSSVGSYTVPPSDFRVRLLDYVQILELNPNPFDAYKLTLSLTPDFAESACFASINFLVSMPPTATTSPSATSSPTAVPTNTAQPAPTNTPTPAPTSTPEPSATPTNTIAPTMTPSQTPEPTVAPTNTAAPTNTPAPTSPPLVTGDTCVNLIGAITTADHTGYTDVGRFAHLNDVYLTGTGATELVGQSLYFQVTTPNGAVKLTSVGQYSVQDDGLFIRLMDYVEMINANPNTKDAYKLVVSTLPDLAAGTCTTSTNFLVQPPAGTQ